MKRFLFSFLLCVLILSGCSRSSLDDVTFEGEWYSSDNAYLYQFSDGSIYCEESYFTLDNGQQITGAYDEYDGYIDAYIIGLGGFKDVKPLYLIKHNGCDALCDSSDGSGHIYFYREQSVAEEIAAKKRAEFDEWFEENNKQETPHATDIHLSPENVMTVSYDSIIAGEHTSEVVGIEAIISSYEYNESLGMYSFDLWYWSDKKNKYIQDKGCFIFERDYSVEAIDMLSTFDDGDKIRMVFEVYQDDSFGTSAYIWSELLQKGTLDDYGIIVSEKTDVTEDAALNDENTEHHVYITNSGDKYHTATCRWVSDSCIEISYKDAIARGYTPCGTCNPSG